MYLTEELLVQIAGQGLDVLPERIRTLINTAMQIERQQFLFAGYGYSSVGLLKIQSFSD